MKHVVNRKGTLVTLLTPKERYLKFKKEMKDKRKYTNEMIPKLDLTGNPEELSARELGFRQGYNGALIEQAKIYKKKHGIKQKRTRKRSNKG